MTQWKRLSKMGISKVSLKLDMRKRKSILIPDLAFVKLLQCASKFGDDLNISANKDLVCGIHGYGEDIDADSYSGNCLLPIPARAPFAFSSFRNCSSAGTKLTGRPSSKEEESSVSFSSRSAA
jgi:hypothetical protein